VQKVTENTNRRLKWQSIALVAYCKPHIHTGGRESHDTSCRDVNQQHSALELQIPRPAQSRCRNLPMRSDQALLGELHGASRRTSVASVATGKVRLLVETIRFDSVGCCETMPAQGLCHRSFEGLDLGFYQDSLCFMVVSVSRVLVVIEL
jgi:hypothetical protein